MSRDAPTWPNSDRRWAWALALVVLGSRLAALAYGYSPVPFYDQWLAEYNNLLLPIAGGQGFSTLFERHNEHVLFTTKLLTLVGYLANGYWDVTFLCVCSALVRALTAALAFRLISEGSSLGSRLALWTLCAVAFGLPVSGYNLLSGMQVSFYLVDLALLGSVFATLRWSSPLAGGVALVLGTALGVLSMASGILIPIATLAAHLACRRPRRGFWPAWILSAAIAAGYTAPIISQGSTEFMNPQGSALTAVVFLFRLLAWPQSSPLLGAALAIGVTVLTWRLGRRTDPDRAFGAILALGAYAGAGAALLAINRDPGSFHPRHWDAIGLLPLSALALGVRSSSSGGAGSRAVAGVSTLLGVSYAIGVGVLSITICLPYLREAHAGRGPTTAHYRAMLISEAKLRSEGAAINAQLGERDYRFFDDPVGRHALHPVVVHNLLTYRPIAQTMLAPEIFPIRPPALVARLTAGVRDGGWLALPAGILLLVTAFVTDRRALSRAPAG